VDGENVVPIEIKSGKTIANNYFDNLHYWHPLTGVSERDSNVVFGGEQSMQTSTGSFISRRQLEWIPGFSFKNYSTIPLTWHEIQVLV
jgi:uncharacterized protein